MKNGCVELDAVSNRHKCAQDVAIQIGSDAAIRGRERTERLAAAPARAGAQIGRVFARHFEAR